MRDHPLAPLHPHSPRAGTRGGRLSCGRVIYTVWLSSRFPSKSSCCVGTTRTPLTLTYACFRRPTPHFSCPSGSGRSTWMWPVSRGRPFFTVSCSCDFFTIRIVLLLRTLSAHTVTDLMQIVRFRSPTHTLRHTLTAQCDDPVCCSLPGLTYLPTRPRACSWRS